MRDLIVTRNITLDGVIDAAGGRFGVAGSGVDQPDVEEALRKRTEAADAALFGRRAFEGMRAWSRAVRSGPGSSCSGTGRRSEPPSAAGAYLW